MKPRFWLLLSVWAGSVLGLRVSDFLTRWFPWFFGLPESQQNFLLVVTPILISLVIWLLVVTRRGVKRGRTLVAERQRLLDAKKGRKGLLNLWVDVPKAKKAQKARLGSIADLIGRVLTVIARATPS